MIQGFDTLNLIKRRSIPYDEYFGDMELSKEQKVRRKNLAFLLEDAIAIWLILMNDSLKNGSLNEVMVKQELTNSIYGIIDEDNYFQDEVERVKYISNFVNETYRSTVENMAKYPNDVVPKEDISEEEITTSEDIEVYWVSNDRAKFIAENEANTICNNEEYLEAVKSGKTEKIWLTYNDDRVRPTHIVVEGARLPIDSYFEVGDALMLFPKDVTSKYSTGASHPEEVINCRCSISYI